MDNKEMQMMVVHAGFEMDALLRRQQELVTQLRALILPALRHADGRSADLAVNLFDDVIDCTSGVMSMLQSVGTAGGGPAAPHNLISNGGAGEGRQEQTHMINNDVGRKRRRNHDKRSRSLVTMAPHYDGHQWRKYGQKNINGRAHARSYYRCAYYGERDCSATKTIQQQEPNGILNCQDEAAKYNVVYYSHHTCKDDGTRNGAKDENNIVDLMQSGEMAGAAADFQKFDEEGVLDVPALLEVLDDSQLNWDIIS